MGSIDADLLRVPEELARLEAEIAERRSRQLELIGRLDRALPALGFPDAAREEVAVACRISPGEAQHRLVAARAVSAADGALARLPQTAQALAAGEIGLEHVQKLAAATLGLDADSARWVEVQVLGDDRARTPGQFAHRARKAALAVGADRAERAAAAHARRELTAWESGGRVTFSWAMPSLDAALVQAWVDTAATRQGPDDVRLAAERRGDALFGLVRDAMTGAGAVGPRRSPARLDVVVTVDALTGGTGASVGAAGGVGTGGRLDAWSERGGRWAGGDPGNRLDGRSVFGEQLRALACDADLRTTLISADGCILDQGRSTRVVSTRLRGLLDLRDQHCRFVGCEVAARWCDAHHVDHWCDGGPTDLRNLVLLCDRHHHAIHDGGWFLDLHADGSATWESPAGQLVRDHAELDTLHLAPPEPGVDDDHPDGAWIRPWWELMREAPLPPPDVVPEVVPVVGDAPPF